MDEAFHASGVLPRTQYEVPAGFAVIAHLVGNGLGTAFMPASEARRFGALRAVELIQHVLWKVYLASPPFDHMTPAVGRVAERLLDAATDARAVK